jgi:hypothetical protein
VATRRGAGGSQYNSAGPDCVANVFVFLRSIIICRWYRRSTVTLQLIVQLSVKSLTGQPLLAGELFLKDPNPLSAFPGGGSFFY